jgi:uncharacterized protein
MLMIMALGVVPGLALGLTGGSGTIFGLPLLVYILGVSTKKAIAICLISISMSSAVGAIQRIRNNEVLFKYGLLIAATGIIFAPYGTKIASHIDDRILLIAFSILCFLISLLIWNRSNVIQFAQENTITKSKYRKLKQNIFIILSSAVTGFLTGLFGIGGGLLIVPALLLIFNTSVKKAIATSLFAMTFITTVAAISYTNRIEIEPYISISFVLGSILGMIAGTAILKRIPNDKLQHFFALMIAAISIIIILKEFSLV